MSQELIMIKSVWSILKPAVSESGCLPGTSACQRWPVRARFTSASSALRNWQTGHRSPDEKRASSCRTSDRWESRPLRSTRQFWNQVHRLKSSGPDFVAGPRQQPARRTTRGSSARCLARLKGNSEPGEQERSKFAFQRMSVLQSPILQQVQRNPGGIWGVGGRCPRRRAKAYSGTGFSRRSSVSAA